MCAQIFLSAEEKSVDPVLGYPCGFAKLCRNAHKQMRGLITPFTDGPPQQFLPYAAQEEEISKLKEFSACFPIVPEAERDSPNARKYADVLWQHLDHLGSAGFDPAKFRVDVFGNVVCWNADPASPLFWEVDHWFPHSRGGKTVVSNLRIVQWQVNQRKKEKLDFLIPWWDLQLGVSVNQFLSAFSSKNFDFRNRYMSYLFLGSEIEQASTHSWPAAFRNQKSRYGLAAAAVVKLQRESLDFDGFNLKSLKAPQCSTPVSTARRRWSLEEEDGLRRALQKFGPGSWKEIKEAEPALANRSTVQIKDKYRLMKGDWNLEKENVTLEKQSSVAAAFQKELQLKAVREEEKRAREAEILQLEQNLREITEVNTKEYEALEDLEVILSDHRREAEKQRRWAETQSSYRLCLERMIRDTLHQTAVYKEQARLSQVACNVLMAKLDTQNAARQAAEEELVMSFQQRKEMMESASNGTVASPAAIRGTDLVDVSSCLSQPVEIQTYLIHDGSDQLLLEDKVVTEQARVEEAASPQKTKTSAKEEPDLKVVVVGYEYERRRQDLVTLKECVEDDDEQTETAKGKVHVDKWLDMVVSNGSDEAADLPREDAEKEEELPREEAEKEEEELLTPSKSTAAANQEQRSKGILSGLLKKLSFKQQLERTMKMNNATTAIKKTDDASADSGECKFKEWNELALEIGKIQVEESAAKVEVGEEDLQAAKVEDVQTSGYTSFDDAVSETPVATERSSLAAGMSDCGSRKGTSLLESLHHEEDVPLEESRGNNSRAWYSLQEWSAKNGLKQSLKVCSQTWMKAMKKLEVNELEVKLDMGRST